MIRFTPHSIALLVSALFLLPLSLPSQASGAEQDAESTLAIDIVNNYRQLRTSCNDQTGNARSMCYYRLRIGLWDYKEARKTLALKGIRIDSQTQVAKSN